MPETLKREANPPQGQFAAPLPQAWDPSILDFRKLTGELVQDHTDPDLRRFAMDVIPWAKVGSLWVPGQVNAQLSGSKTTPATTLFDNLSTTGTSTSAWLPCSGYNRAVVLVQTSANFMGYVAIQTRADSDIAVAPMYVLNTAIAMPRSGIPGYYELDVNPMSDLRALAFIEQGSVTVRVWLSATPFVPDLPGAELTMFNALAIRDTAVHRGPIFSGTAFRRARLHVHNTHDSAVTLTASASDGNWLRKSDGTSHQLQIPANRQRVIYTASDWPILDGPWPDQVRIYAQCATAPTAGALTVTLIAEAM